MFKDQTTIRVRYAETDQMGVVYYGNYAQYFEVGRVEALRELGTSYRNLEEQGIQMPVVSLHVEFRNPARYDDELTVHTIIKEVPGVRIHFEYLIENSQGLEICNGATTLAFIDVARGRPCRAPRHVVDAIANAIGQ